MNMTKFVKYQVNRTPTNFQGAMITINHDKFANVLAAYKAQFPSHIEEEIYKWKAVKKFQDTWDIDAPDFGAMFQEATSLHDNLLASMNHYPRGMVMKMY